MSSAIEPNLIWILFILCCHFIESEMKCNEKCCLFAIFFFPLSIIDELKSVENL